MLVLRHWVQLEPAGGPPPDGSLTARVWPGRGPGETPEPRPVLSLVVGMDLATARAYGALARQHGSRDFVAFLEGLDLAYAPGVRVRLLLDQHAAHRAAATRRYLAVQRTVSNWHSGPGTVPGKRREPAACRIAIPAQSRS